MSFWSLFCRDTLRELLRLVMLSSMHPSGLEVVWTPWKQADAGQILSVLRPYVVRHLTSRPSSKLRAAIRELDDQLIRSSREATRKGWSCMLARLTPTPLPTPTLTKRTRLTEEAVDGTLAVQIRTWRDASSYQPNQTYTYFWPCVAHAALKLKETIQRRTARRSREPRVMVWLTSDDLPRMVPQFFSGLSALRKSNISLAAPACYPIPGGGKYKQAQDSRSGDVRAIAHWWKLGASDGMVVSGSTYSYSAWLRAGRSGERNYGLDLKPAVAEDATAPHTFENACHVFRQTISGTSIKWR